MEECRDSFQKWMAILKRRKENKKIKEEKHMFKKGEMI